MQGQTDQNIMIKIMTREQGSYGPCFSLILVLMWGCHSGTGTVKYSEQIEKTEKIFDQWNKDDSPGCALGIVKDGILVYANGFGIANLEYVEPITSRSVFRIGSVSKQFTAACVLLLEEDGRLALDDDVRKYIPELPEYGQTVTLRHMLLHTSGLPEYLTLLYESGDFVDDLDYFSETEAVTALAKGPGSSFRAGEKYEYCNSNYFLLSVVVKRAAGMTLAEYAMKNIFQPLGMEHTHFHDDVTDIVKDRATGYGMGENGDWKIDETTLEIVGDGSVFTTIEDMYLWDQNLYRNRLGKGGQGLIDKMRTSGRLNNGELTDYGFGLSVDTYRGLPRIGHGGSWAGFRANYMRFPDQMFTVMVLCNLGSMTPGALAEEVAAVWIGGSMDEE